MVMRSMVERLIAVDRAPVRVAITKRNAIISAKTGRPRRLDRVRLFPTRGRFGTGAEYALWDNWTAKIEYSMMDFGNSGPFTDNKFNIINAGINYRFGAPGWHF